MTKENNIDHPSHYVVGGYECMRVIEALSLGFHLGNVMKYIWRAGRKGDTLEDLKKARMYLNRQIELMEHELMGEEEKSPEKFVRAVYVGHGGRYLERLAFERKDKTTVNVMLGDRRIAMAIPSLSFKEGRAQYQLEYIRVYTGDMDVGCYNLFEATKLIDKLVKQEHEEG